MRIVRAVVAAAARILTARNAGSSSLRSTATPSSASPPCRISGRSSGGRCLARRAYVLPRAARRRRRRLVGASPRRSASARRRSRSNRPDVPRLSAGGFAPLSRQRGRCAGHRHAAAGTHHARRRLLLQGGALYDQTTDDAHHHSRSAARGGAPVVTWLTVPDRPSACGTPRSAARRRAMRTFCADCGADRLPQRPAARPRDVTVASLDTPADHAARASGRRAPVDAARRRSAAARATANHG